MTFRSVGFARSYSVPVSSQLPAGYEFHEWRPNEVSRFWDFVAQTQPDAYFAHRVGGNVVRNFRELIRGSNEIVDFGCGSGRFLEYLAREGRRVAGYDSSPESLEQTRGRLAGYENFVGAYGPGSLNELSGRFDLAFCLEVVEHLYDPELSEAFADIRAVLSADGHLVITTPNDEDLSEGWICSPESGRIFHRWQHVRSWTADSLQARLEIEGFEVVSNQLCNAEALGFRPRSLAVRAGFSVLRRRPRNLFAVARKR
jgi:2-polyprenyl-3-methyl-5-hydroxy-6-metoxy-1,4-benzoquinol methylase